MALGCAPEEGSIDDEIGTGGVQQTVPPDFSAAVEATDVPSELLFALARAETGLQMVVGESEFEGQDPAFGIMGLRGYDLELAAGLAGLDVELVRTDRDANLAAAAALLAAIAEEMQIDTADLDAWAPVVARYSGIDDEQGAAEYVHREVYAALRDGIEVEGYAMPPLEVDPHYPKPLIDTQRGRDSGAIWSPSPNKNSRGGRTPEYVIIHTCEGGYSGCWSWLTNSSSGVSAHYVVNDSGSEVRALVDEDDRAWHISADYACSRNDDRDCSNNGTSMNTLSVGIEHAGYGSQSSWSAGLIQRSAELACGITERNSIPRDAYHIIGHGQMQPWNRSDPGANWPWSSYLDKVRDACGDGGATPSGGSGTSVVIDSNNTANVTSQFYVDVSSNWWGSAATPGHWNTGYWVASTSPVSDAAEFWFYANSGSCYDVEAWWTQGSNRASAATFIGWDTDGTEVGRTTVNLRTNGNRWNDLGTWDFGSGWNRVLLSRWTTSGRFVVADAVRVTPTQGPCN